MANLDGSMLYNLSQSLIPFQALVSGVGYIAGIAMFFVGFEKLRAMGDYRPQSRSHEKAFVIIAYFVGGTALIYLPSAVVVLANTAFGSDSILQYASTDPYNIVDSIKVMIQTAGVIWFVRGVVLMVHASEPGVQEGRKGLFMMCAGICGIYINQTLAGIDYVFYHLFELMKH